MAAIEMENFKSLENIDNLIKGGQLAKARQALLEIKSQYSDLNKVSSKERVYYCSLLRRSDLSIEGIKILQPIIYPKARRANAANAEERLEYASCLVRLEILNEAEKVLKTIDFNQYPIAYVRIGFLFITRWDYEQANDYFKNYIEHPLADPYNIKIAQLNLLQGLVYLRKVEEAWSFAKQLLKTFDPVENKLLLGAVYEFCAEIFRLKKDNVKAVMFIESAKDLLQGDQSLDEFLIRKQEGLILCQAVKQIGILTKLRKEAQQRKHYESIRDLDFHIALIKKNERLLNQVYWKTQSQFYKNRIRQLAEENKINLDVNFYQFGKNKGLCFDLSSHQLSGVLQNLKPHKSLAKLLTAFLVEGYKPLQIFDLFSIVFEDEIFFPDSSSDKMHQLIKRLRHYILKNNLPMQIVCKGKLYQLQITGHFSLSSGNQYQSDWERRLREKVKHNYFNVIEAQKVWHCSMRTALRRLADLKKKKYFLTSGKTRSTRYRFMRL